MVFRSPVTNIGCPFPVLLGVASGHAEVGTSGSALPLPTFDRQRGSGLRCLSRFGCRMGRLTGMPSRLSSLPPRVAAMPKVAESFYKSAAWLAYRKQHREWTIAKHGGVWCVQCGSTKRLILDHKHERKDGGADLPAFEEMEWLCIPDHNRKTAMAKAKRARGGR